MGSGEAEVSMAAQGINTTIQVANTTVQTIMQLMLREQPQLRNPEALVVDIRDIDKVLNELNSAGIPWTTCMERHPIYKKDEYDREILDAEGKPILIGYEETPARTPDGMNCIIMVSGHDRPLIDPETGQVVLTEKGNTKMIGGNIDKAVAIRNAVRDSQINHAIDGVDLPKDNIYQGDYVKIEFPGVESRGRFVKDILDTTSCRCILPVDNSDRSVFVRQDLFEINNLASRVLKDFYFKQQFPDYATLVDRLNKDLDNAIEITDRAATDPNLLVRFGSTLKNNAFPLIDITSEPAYIKDQKGYIYGEFEGGKWYMKSFNLTNDIGRSRFIQTLQSNGYTFAIEGSNIALGAAEFKARCEQDSIFKDFQDNICSLDANYGELISNNIHLDFKNGDEIANPERGSTWTSIELKIDNTSLVNQITVDLDKNSPNTDFNEKVRNQMQSNTDHKITVTMIDGKSLSAALYATEIIRNSEEKSIEHGSDSSMIENVPDRDPIDVFHDEHFSNEDHGHIKDVSAQENDLGDTLEEATIDNTNVSIVDNSDIEQSDNDLEPHI